MGNFSFDVAGPRTSAARALWSDDDIATLRTHLVRKAARHGLPQDAEDAAQETLCRALARRSELEMERVAGWLSVVAKNVTTDHHRAQARLNVLRTRLLHRHETHDDHSDEVLDGIFARQAVAAVEALPPLQREVLTSVASGNTIAEIADDKKLSTRSVEGHLRRARQSVRRWLSQ
jgi:RNA polymerase sigma factor (sigma-70 family)